MHSCSNKTIESEFGDPSSPFGWKAEYNGYFENLERFKHEPLKHDRSIRLIKLSVKTPWGVNIHNRRTGPVKKLRPHWEHLSPEELYQEWLFTALNEPLEDKDDFDSATTPDSFAGRVKDTIEVVDKDIYLNLNPADCGFAPLEISTCEVSSDLPPKFEAVSYVWGGTERQAVICDGKILMVSRNCARALYHIAYWPHGPTERLFWIDQVCINQEDLIEKGDQGFLMPTIYENASMTIGWLGEADGAWQHLFYTYQDNREGFCGRRSHNPVKPDELFRITQEPYFKRGWIVQETTLSNRITFLCGTYVLPWAFLVALREACKAPRSETVTGQKIESDTLARFVALRQEDGNRHAWTLSLTDALQIALSMWVSDEKDRLYALYGSCEAIRRLVSAPDYTITAREMWSSFLSAIISAYGPDSCILWQLISTYTTGEQQAYSDKSAQLSWMPDFSSGPSERGIRNLALPNQLRECCRKIGQASLLPMGPMGLVLNCQCTFLGGLGDVLGESVDCLLNANIREKIKTLHEFSPVRTESPKKITLRDYDPWGIFFDLVGDHPYRFTFDTKLPFDNAPEWNNMKVFVSSSQWLVIAPKRASADDKIVLFAGDQHSGQLSVIRKFGEYGFTYIGTCFVYGWRHRRDGDGNWHREGMYPGEAFGSETITLC